MTLHQAYELARKATAKRAANSMYQPSLEELSAINLLLVEQAKKRLNNSA